MKNHDKRTEPGMRRGVTLSAVLSLLQPYDHVFIECSINPHELEAVGGGTAGADCRQTNRRLDRQDTPVLVITIGEKEKEAEL